VRNVVYIAVNRFLWSFTSSYSRQCISASRDFSKLLVSETCFSGVSQDVEARAERVVDVMEKVGFESITCRMRCGLCEKPSPFSSFSFFCVKRAL